MRVQEELGWEFMQIYGLTETSPLLTVNRTRAEWDDLAPEERAAKLVRAGAPAIGVRLRTDDQGEVLARSNVILDGYWERPDETERALVDGWFHTGDGGVIGDDGYLTISDRKKDVIIDANGKNVYPDELEDLYGTHAHIKELSVVGLPDDEDGMREFHAAAMAFLREPHALKVLWPKLDAGRRGALCQAHRQHQ